MTSPDKNGWLPIDNAPDDGDPVLCIDANGLIRVGVCKLFFDKSGKYEYFRDDKVIPGHTWSMVPTHWQPLPGPPESGEAE